MTLERLTDWRRSHDLSWHYKLASDCIINWKMVWCEGVKTNMNASWSRKAVRRTSAVVLLSTAGAVCCIFQSPLFWADKTTSHITQSHHFTTLLPAQTLQGAYTADYTQQTLNPSSSSSSSLSFSLVNFFIIIFLFDVMQTKWLTTSIQRFKHRTWWFEPSQLDHLWKSKTNTTNVQSYSINVINDNTLCTDNADVLPTWFPDAGFNEKLTKLSFLKLSERQEGTHLYIKLLFGTNTFVYARTKIWSKIQRQPRDTKHKQ